MTRTLVVTVLAVTLASAGCYHVTVRTNRTPSDVVHENTAHMFLWGMFGSEVNPGCEAAIVETKQGFVDLVLYALTGGLYSPETVKTTCAAGA
jgi:hypothetical protein